MLFRSYKQLIGKGLSATIPDLLLEIRLRDQRDSERAAAPLRQCDDAVLLDTTRLTIAESVAKALALYRS